MAKQGGGIARITSFFGVAEYEGAHEHQGNSEAEGAATSAQPEESSARLNALPTPLDGGHKRRDARQESSAAADRGYDNSADNHWEDDTVQDNAEVEYTQDQYGYEDGELAEEYPEDYGADDYPSEEEEDELRRITTIHPRSYNDAKIIGEAFREDIPVIMNVDDMPDADAKRLVDFASGLVFALNGRIERVTAKVFLLTPSDLEVLGITSSDDMPQAFDDEGLVPFDQG